MRLLTARSDTASGRGGARHGNQRWADGILYTTGEPCPMCMSAIVWAGIGGVVYGSSITALAEVGIARIMIGASAVRDAAPFYRGRIMGGSYEPRPTRCSAIGSGGEAC